MTPTTLRLVAADLASQVRQISPDFGIYDDHVWSQVLKVDEVAGERMRLFYGEFESGEAVTDGIYGTAIEYESQLRVWTNYRGIHDTDSGQDVVAEMITADSRQLWLALEARQDPTLDGLISVVQDGPFSFEDSEPGNIWGSHDFTVRYLLAHN